MLSELLQGVRSDGERRTPRRGLLSLPHAEVLRADWLATGEALRRLRKSSVTEPLTDARIAVVAIRNRTAVLTLVSHTRHLDARLLEVPFE